jgi:hypothetical protein
VLVVRDRLATAGPSFREFVMTPVLQGRADDTFVDAVCEPPQTFTYGGVLAHVLTFSAVRRTLAIGALDSAGITDLGSATRCTSSPALAPATTPTRSPGHRRERSRLTAYLGPDGIELQEDP